MPETAVSRMTTGREESVSAGSVLIVDDESEIRESLQTLLELEGYEVETAATGQQGLHRIGQRAFDLILLDLGLPKLNGIKAARQIRKLTPESKIIFLSQESSDDVVQEAISFGALGYVVKTRVGSDLVPAVKAVLEGRQFVSSGLITSGSG